MAVSRAHRANTGQLQQKVNPQSEGLLMSLSVHAFVRDAADELNLLEPEHPGEELAGTEDFRFKLYASPLSIQLGFKLLPRLARENLLAEGDDVQMLKLEALEIINHLEAFAVVSEISGETIAHRIGNILRALEQAVTVQGGVVIW
jgi:hypothetical protein